MFGDTAARSGYGEWSATCEDCNLEYTDESAQFYAGNVFSECPKCERVKESVVR